ncbi:hypothetical protein Tco_1265494 [Tanacetum coccineum]
MQMMQLTRVVTNPKNSCTNLNRAIDHDTSKSTPAESICSTSNLSSFGETFMHMTMNPNMRDTSEKNDGSGSFFSSIPSVLIESTNGGTHDYCDGVMVIVLDSMYTLCCFVGKSDAHAILMLLFGLADDFEDNLFELKIDVDEDLSNLAMFEDFCHEIEVYYTSRVRMSLESHVSPNGYWKKGGKKMVAEDVTELFATL